MKITLTAQIASTLLWMAAANAAPQPEGGRFESLGIPVRMGGLMGCVVGPNGKGGKLYACTYPNAKLVSFDPKTGVMADLGRMHPTEMYARSLAVGPNGKVYVGIGTEKGDLVVYDPSTATHRSIIPKELEGAK